MPYIIKKKQNCYSVVNENTGKIYSFCSTKENAQKQKKLLNAIDHGFIPRQIGGGNSFDKLPIEQILALIKNLEIKELVKICSINKRYSKICKKYSKEIFKNILDKFKVDYNDKTNFIYIANDVDIQDYIKDDLINYYEIFKLYGAFYYNKSIEFTKTNERKDITSFPVYPHMEKCDIHYTLISNFPTQPNMTSCNLSFNKIKNFDIQPKMTECIINNNLLTEFKIHPVLEFLKATGNRIEKFSAQPMMKTCIVENNSITEFQIQPQMRILFARNNNLDILQTQPEMIGCELQSCGLRIVEIQPKMICCNFSNNNIEEFINHENLIMADLSSNNITNIQQIDYYNVEGNPIYESLKTKNSDFVQDVVNFFLLSYKNEKEILKSLIKDFVNSQNINRDDRFMYTWFEDDTGSLSDDDD